MEEKPTLEYVSPVRRITRTHQLATIATTSSIALLAPGVVTMFTFFIGAVPKHWLSGYQFDLFIGTAVISNGVGFLLDIFAIVLGKHHPAVLVAVVHFFAAVILPSFGYA